MVFNKKNILQKMTGRYDAATAQQDAGKRLIQLQELQDDIGRAINLPRPGKALESAVLAFGFLGSCATGATTGALLFPPGFLSVIGGIGGGVVGFLVGGFTVIDAKGGEKVLNRIHSRREVAHVGKVMPYVPALKDLSAKIDQDCKMLLESDEVVSLQSSSHLGVLLRRYPGLKARFAEANERAYANAKAFGQDAENKHTFKF